MEDHKVTMLTPREIHKSIQALSSDEDAARRQSLQLLKDAEDQGWDAIADEEAGSLVRALQRLLRDYSNYPIVRQQILTILGRLGPRAAPAVPQLLELLHAGTPIQIRERAVVVLGKIGGQARRAVDGLLKMLVESSGNLLIETVRALASIGCADDKVQTALVALWRSPPSIKGVQVQVAVALSKLKIQADGVQLLLTRTLVMEQNAALRLAAAGGLACCSSEETDVVPALLLVALNDKIEYVRTQAETTLAQLLPSREQCFRLCALQLDSSPYAEMALRKGGAGAVPGLVLALKSGQADSREKAIRTLGSLGEVANDAVPELTRALADQDRSIRLAAAKAIWNVTKKGELAVPALVRLLGEKWSSTPETEEPRRRFLQTVIESLWRIGPTARAAIPALNEKTRDKNRMIRESAVSALKGIAPTGAKAD
jgi:HEAT repeat protein